VSSPMNDSRMRMKLVCRDYDPGRVPGKENRTAREQNQFGTLDNSESQT
jgi:hypothetical protein